MTAFALQYRPHRFSDLVGQTPAAAVLYQLARRKKVPPALLFAGVRGCGKTSAARILGATLNCQAETGPATAWPCTECSSCHAVTTGTSLNVTEVDAASHGGVEQIRSIRERALYGTAGEHHLFILDEAHAITRDGFNALLKVLEEPPPFTTFALLTTEPGRILPTVASRCMPFTFSRIPVAAIRQRLEFICRDQQLDLEPALLAAIAERSDGAMRDAVMLLEQVSSVGITDLARWQTLLGETDFAPALLSHAAQGAIPEMFSALDRAVASTGDHGWVIGQLATCMRDALVLCSGGTVERQGGQLEERQRLARHLTPARAVAGLRVLWDLQTRVRAEDRARGLEVACVMLSDALTPVRDDPQPDQAAGCETSIAQLRDLVGRA